MTFFLFGKYSLDSLRGISPERTKLAEETIAKLGGKIKAMYVLLGKHDLVLIAELPGLEEAIKFSVTLAEKTGIAFSSQPALTVADFDQLMAGK